MLLMGPGAGTQGLLSTAGGADEGDKLNERGELSIGLGVGGGLG